MIADQEEYSLQENELDPLLQYQLLQVSKWTRLISIVGFSLGAFVVVIMLFSGAMVFRTIVDMLNLPFEGMYGLLIGVFFIIFFLAAAVLYFLHKASKHLKEGAANKDSLQIGEGFLYLHRFFIMAAIFSGLSLLANISTLFQ